MVNSTKLHVRKIGRAVTDHWTKSFPTHQLQPQARVKNAPIYRGSAKTMIYVPGLASYRRSEKSKALGDFFIKEPFYLDFMTIDCNGHGDAEGRLEEVTLTRCIEDLSRVIDYISASSDQHTENKNVILFGYSLGALVAAYCAAFQRKDRIHALIMLAPGIQFAKRLQTGNHETLNSEKITVESNYCEPIHLSHDFLTDLCSYDEKQLRGALVDIPLLVMHGSHDDVIPFDTVESWFKRVEENNRVTSQAPTAALCCVNKGNHRLNMSIDFILDKTSKFLAGLD
mmetsp:Transcript_22359/g.28601  ORF Transcript_22359/g.28601 Transcript_22359/m.28601 type:complete len:284 (-) Transcript_22359:721-1572(-)